MTPERSAPERSEDQPDEAEADAVAGRATPRILTLKGASRSGDAPPLPLIDGDARTAEFTATLERHRGARHLVVLQDYPDPDSISSAFAHRLIAEQYDIDVDVTYSGRVSHQENIALVRLLNLDLIPYDADRVDLQTYDGAVFVDSQGTTSSVRAGLEEAGVPTVIIVDHHERQEGATAEFVDLRKVGATATIYTDYLQHHLLNLESSRREHVLLATSLMHGIMTDTRTLLRGRPEDFMAAAFLAQFHDANLLSEIMSQQRSKAVMDTVQRALANRLVTQNYAIAGIGYIRAENRDAIPQAADFLLTEENVHTAIVYGIVLGGRDYGTSEESLVGSLRTSKLTMDPDQFIKDVFGRSAAGRYFGGGKREAGGFEVPIDFLAGATEEEYAELKWQVYDRQIKQRLMAKIGVRDGEKK